MSKTEYQISQSASVSQSALQHAIKFYGQKETSKREKNHLFHFKVTTKFQCILYIISIYILYVSLIYLQAQFIYIQNCGNMKLRVV